MLGKHSSILLWCSLAFSLAWGLPQALAGPPFITDDPEPVEYQHWEFYVASLDFKTNRAWFGTAPHVEANYGVVSNVQLHLIEPLNYYAASGQRTDYGPGDTELGVKFRFLQETERMPQVGVFPLLEVPIGNVNENLGNGGTELFLPVWLQKSWGSWTAYGGGGYGFNSGPGNEDWTYVGGLLQKQVLTNVLVGVEIYHRTEQFTGEGDDTAFNVGAVIDFSEQHHLLISAGRSISGPTQFQCYVAYQFTFDNSFFHLGKK